MKIQVNRKLIFWYWRLKSSNGEILATSETYYSKANALRAANKIGEALKFPVEVIS